MVLFLYLHTCNIVFVKQKFFPIFKIILVSVTITVLFHDIVFHNHQEQAGITLNEHNTPVHCHFMHHVFVSKIITVEKQIKVNISPEFSSFARNVSHTAHEEYNIIPFTPDVEYRSLRLFRTTPIRGSPVSMV